MSSKIFLKSLQVAVVCAITVLSSLLLKHQYVEHFPVGPRGKCLVFYSEALGGQLVEGVIFDSDMPSGETGVMVLSPADLMLSGVIGFRNSDIREHGYIVMECKDEKAN